MKNTLVLLMIAGICLAVGLVQTASAQSLISNVTVAGSPDGTSYTVVTTPPGLVEDADCYLDRTHDYNNIPEEIVGIEYVLTRNDDRNDNITVTFTLSDETFVYLFLDNRMGHGNLSGDGAGVDPDLTAAGMTWVANLGFVDTDLDIGIDESGDGDIDRWSSVFQATLPAGQVQFGAQNDPTRPTSRNMYGFGAVPPNVAPVVDAGPDIQAALVLPSVQVLVQGTVEDDGKPLPNTDPVLENEPNQLTFGWQILSSPAGSSPSLIDDNPDDADIILSADIEGLYVLELSAFDGELGSNDVVDIKVFPEGYDFLVGHWKLDETGGRLAADSAGVYDFALEPPAKYYHDGAVLGSRDPNWVDGVDWTDTPVLTEPTDFGNAMFFDSEQGQWIDCGTDTNFSIGGNHPKTATAWVHTRRFNNGGIFEYGEHNDGQNFALRTLSSAVDSWRVQYWGDYDIDFTFPSLNAWVHFALVHDAQRTKVYANSQLIVDEARTLNTNDQANFEIGRYDVSNFFHGVIDDVRLYSRALTKQDILDVAQIHNAPPTADAGPDLRLIQEIGDSDTIAITEAVVTDIPGDITITWSLLSGPGAIEFDDAGIANPTITFDGVSFGFYHLQLLVEDNQNTEWTATDDMYIMYQEKDLYGLVGLWTLDEETGLVAPDTSGNGLDGTLAAVPREGVEDPNVPVWQPTLGKIDGAVQCINTGENIDQYVDLSRVPGTDDITLMFWAKPDVVANMQVLDKMPYTTPAGNAGWSARLRSDGTAQFRIGDDHDNFTNVDAANAYQAGQWTHIAMTFDSAAGEGRVYVNGLQGAVGTTTHTINTLYPPVQLGLPAMTDTNDKYRGLVDQVRIYDRALSPLEVARQAIADALEIDGCQLSIPGVRMTGDLNEDCFVDLLDFNLMAGEWLDCTDLNVDACWQ